MKNFLKNRFFPFWNRKKMLYYVHKERNSVIKCKSTLLTGEKKVSIWRCYLANWKNVLYIIQCRRSHKLAGFFVWPNTQKKSWSLAITTYSWGANDASKAKDDDLYPPPLSIEQHIQSQLGRKNSTFTVSFFFFLSSCDLLLKRKIAELRKYIY